MITENKFMALEKFDTARLKGNLVTLWPYHAPLFPASTFYNLWTWMENDKLLDLVFYEDENFTFVDFVRFFDERLMPGRLLLIATNNKDFDGVGFVWFDNIKSFRANGNIFIRKKYWGERTDEVARIALDYIFNGMDIPRIFVYTPDLNKRTVAYMKRIGFREIAQVPDIVKVRNNICGLVIGMMKKEDYNGRKGT